MNWRRLGVSLYAALAAACDGAEPDSVDSVGNGDDTETDAGSVNDVADAAPVEGFPLTSFCAELRRGWVARCERDGRAGCRSEADDGKGDEVCLAVARAIEEGRTRYDGARAKECLESEAFDVVKAWQTGWIPPLVCDGIFEGTARFEEACYPDETFQRICAEGFCDRDGNCPGSCETYVETGESCASAPCQPGAFCDGENVCRHELEIGQPCPDGGGCALPGACADGVCRLLADLGEACDAAAPCAYPYYCSDSLCVLEVGRGEVCDEDKHCAAELACAFVPLGGTARECRARPGADEPCDRRTGCEAGLVCASDGSPFLGTCVPGESATPEVTPEPRPAEPTPCTGD